MSKRYKNGYGNCQQCHRSIGATRKGFAYRHGHCKLRPQACIGSGVPLLHWKKQSKWERERLI